MKFKGSMLLAAMMLAGATMPHDAHAKTGLASWHDELSGLTTAAKYLPCGTILKVRNARDGKAKWVRITVRDYGPFAGHRIFDLSPYAFRKVFGSTKKGVARLQYKVVKRGHCRIHRHDGGL